MKDCPSHKKSNLQIIFWLIAGLALTLRLLFIGLTHVRKTNIVIVNFIQNKHILKTSPCAVNRSSMTTIVCNKKKYVALESTITKGTKKD